MQLAVVASVPVSMVWDVDNASPGELLSEVLGRVRGIVLSAGRQLDRQTQQSALVGSVPAEQQPASSLCLQRPSNSTVLLCAVYCGHTRVGLFSCSLGVLDAPLQACTQW